MYWYAAAVGTPGVVKWDLWRNAFPPGTDPNFADTGWSEFVFGTIDPDEVNIMNDSSPTHTLGSLGLSAGDLVYFQLARDTTVASNMPFSAFLLSLTITPT